MDFDMAHVDKSLLGHITLQKVFNSTQKGIDHRSSGKAVMTPGSVSTKSTLHRPDNVVY